MKRFEKVVLIKGNETIVRIEDKITNNTWVGKAVCSSLDKNNVNKGIEIATTRARLQVMKGYKDGLKLSMKVNRDLIKKLERENKAKQKKLISLCEVESQALDKLDQLVA